MAVIYRVEKYLTVLLRDVCLILNLGDIIVDFQDMEERTLGLCIVLGPHKCSTSAQENKTICAHHYVGPPRFHPSLTIPSMRTILPPFFTSYLFLIAF